MKTGSLYRSQICVKSVSSAFSGPPPLHVLVCFCPYCSLVHCPAVEETDDQTSWDVAGISGEPLFPRLMPRTHRGELAGSPLWTGLMRSRAGSE